MKAIDFGLVALDEDEFNGEEGSVIGGVLGEREDSEASNLVSSEDGTPRRKKNGNTPQSKFELGTDDAEDESMDGGAGAVIQIGVRHSKRNQ
eukprot:CAMPEP_0172521402 /NCGR_PEP_ID=MMETSP1066-20121228/292560_1 /TAXON_ID=671091 /ORGANISM="Coscinodiscus wailesii, Strain CCMP2513" /LENGTH=91 /DNA_ID=CAMNT_0013304309 /DNA_START=2127 /DNA_END=2402 /DNA_ORIENTATION=-